MNSPIITRDDMQKALSDAVDIGRIAVTVEHIASEQKEQKQENAKVHDELFGRMRSMEETLNKGKGAYAASILFAGTIGAFITKGIAVLGGRG